MRRFVRKCYSVELLRFAEEKVTRFFFSRFIPDEDGDMTVKKNTGMCWWLMILEDSMQFWKYPGALIEILHEISFQFTIFFTKKFFHESF